MSKTGKFVAGPRTDVISVAFLFLRSPARGRVGERDSRDLTRAKSRPTYHARRKRSEITSDIKKKSTPGRRGESILCPS